MKSDFSLTPADRSGRPRRPIEIMMTPMIDAIFLLLVFFLTTSSFQIPEKLLPTGVSEVSLPSGQSDRPPPEPNPDAIEQIIIKGSLDGGRVTWLLNNIRMEDVSQVKERLRALSQLQPDVPVIIDPEGKVPLGDVVTVYDAAREVGLSRAFLATRKPTRGNP